MNGSRRPCRYEDPAFWLNIAETIAPTLRPDRDPVHAVEWAIFEKMVSLDPTLPKLKRLRRRLRGWESLMALNVNERARDALRFAFDLVRTEAKHG